MKHPVLLNPALIFAGALLMGMTGLPCAALAQTMETDEQLFMQNVTAPPPEPVEEAPPEPVEEVSPAEVPEEFQMENDGVQLVSVSDAPVSESPQEPPPPSPNPEIVVVSEPPPEEPQPGDTVMVAVTNIFADIANEVDNNGLDWITPAPHTHTNWEANENYLPHYQELMGQLQTAEARQQLEAMMQMAQLFAQLPFIEDQGGPGYDCDDAAQLWQQIFYNHGIFSVPVTLSGTLNGQEVGHVVLAVWLGNEAVVVIDPTNFDANGLPDFLESVMATTLTANGTGGIPAAFNTFLQQVHSEYAEGATGYTATGQGFFYNTGNVDELAGNTVGTLDHAYDDLGEMFTIVTGYAFEDFVGQGMPAYSPGTMELYFLYHTQFNTGTMTLQQVLDTLENPTSTQNLPGWEALIQSITNIAGGIAGASIGTGTTSAGAAVVP